MVSFGLAGYGLNKKKQQSSSSIYKMLPRTLASAGASARALVRGRSAPPPLAPPGASAASAVAAAAAAGRSSPARRRCACRAPPTRRRRATRPSRPGGRRHAETAAKADASPARAAGLRGPPRGRSPAPRPSRRAPTPSRRRRRARRGAASRSASATQLASPKLAKYDEAWIEQKLDENADYGDLARNVECFVSRAVDDAQRARAASLVASWALSPGPPGSDARPPPAAPPGAPAAAAEHPLGPCDKCDGPHATSRCPHFAKDRDDHPDAQRAKGLACGADGGNADLRRGEVIRQPGDGSCLFHSLARLRLQNRHGDARQLRRELMDWLSRNPDASIADTPVGDWVKWDSNCSVDDYTARMRGAGWGGGIEMAAFARRFDLFL
ncbi:hypothetical protein JL721_11154 [Aureococcus anophagefferens]|nr:hypothetical protein JL721_11154 [Aureococcus anophagefferens]